VVQALLGATRGGPRLLPALLVGVDPNGITHLPTVPQLHALKNWTAAKSEKTQTAAKVKRTARRQQMKRTARRQK
jgi:flagellar biogenesis protein FliO